MAGSRCSIHGRLRIWRSSWLWAVLLYSSQVFLSWNTSVWPSSSSDEPATASTLWVALKPRSPRRIRGTYMPLTRCISLLPLRVLAVLPSVSCRSWSRCVRSLAWTLAGSAGTRLSMSPLITHWCTVASVSPAGSLRPNASTASWMMLRTSRWTRVASFSLRCSTNSWAGSRIAFGSFSHLAWSSACWARVWASRKPFLIWLLLSWASDSIGLYWPSVARWKIPVSSSNARTWPRLASAILTNMSWPLFAALRSRLAAFSPATPYAFSGLSGPPQ